MWTLPYPTPATIVVKKGRIAATTKTHSALGLTTTGVWSVVVSDGFYEGPVTSSGRAARLIDVLFFASKRDAWEESAYLLGERTDEAPSVSLCGHSGAKHTLIHPDTSTDSTTAQNDCTDLLSNPKL